MTVSLPVESATSAASEVHAHVQVVPPVGRHRRPKAGHAIGFAPAIGPIAGTSIVDVLLDSGAPGSLMASIDAVALWAVTYESGSPYPRALRLRPEFAVVHNKKRQPSLVYHFTGIPPVEAEVSVAATVAAAAVGTVAARAADPAAKSKWIPALYGIAPWGDVEWGNLNLGVILRRIYHDLVSPSQGRTVLLGNFRVAAFRRDGNTAMVTFRATDADGRERECPGVCLRLCDAPEMQPGQRIKAEDAFCVGSAVPASWRETANKKGSSVDGFVDWVTGSAGSRAIAQEVSASWIKSKSIAADNGHYFIPIAAFNQPRQVFIDLADGGDLGQWSAVGGESGVEMFVGPYTRIPEGMRSVPVGVGVTVEFTPG